MLLEVTGVSPIGVKVSVKAPAVPVMTKLVKVATPATAATVVVPLSVPLPLAIDATTFCVKLVTVCALEFITRTTGCVPSADPLVAVVDGWVVIALADADKVVSVTVETSEMFPAVSTTTTYAL